MTRNAKNPVIKFELTGEMKFSLNYDSEVLGDHVLDFNGLPEEKRKGQPLRMLCASALSCYAGSIYLEMAERGALVRRLRGFAHPVLSAEEDGSNRLDAIKIKVEVDVPDEHRQTLNSVIEFLNNGGCPITRHFSHPIDIRGEVKRVSG